MPVRAGSGRLPRALLAALLLGLVVFVLVGHDSYGRTYDELWQDDYGRRSLKWYASFGSDTSFLDFPAQLQLPLHGPFFETIVAAFQAALPADGWTVRALVCGLTGVLGIALAGLCGRELGRSASLAAGDRPALERAAVDGADGWWVALAAAVGLTLYPRYTGAIFNNSKDVPLAVALLLVLFLVLRMVRRWDQPRRGRLDHGVVDAVLVGVALGATLSIRVNAFFWYGVLVLLVLGWWLLHGRLLDRHARRSALRRVSLAGVALVVSSYVAMAVTWPYVFLNPVTGLPDALRSMGDYEWDRQLLFGGEIIKAPDAPWHYALTWLFIGSPLPVVLLVLGGLAWLVRDLVRRRVPTAPLLAAAAGLAPLAAIVVLDATLYNALRHILFVVPPLVVVAAWAVVRLVAVLGRSEGRRKVLAPVVALTVAAGYAHVVWETVRLHPYEYMYFSAAVGGYEGAHSDYETDYWGACSTEAARWLAEHWREHTDRPTATVRNLHAPTGLIVPELPEGLVPIAEPPPSPDFAILTIMDWRRDPWPKYRVLHTVEVEGDPLCQVKMRSR